MARKRKSLAPRRRKTRRRKGRRGGKKPKIYGFSVKEWEKMSPREQFSIRVHDAAKRRGKKGTYEVRKWMAIDEGHPEWAGGSTRRKRRTTKRRKKKRRRTKRRRGGCKKYQMAFPWERKHKGYMKCYQDCGGEEECEGATEERKKEIGDCWFDCRLENTSGTKGTTALFNELTPEEEEDIERQAEVLAQPWLVYKKRADRALEGAVRVARFGQRPFTGPAAMAAAKKLAANYKKLATRYYSLAVAARLESLGLDARGKQK